MNPAMIVDLPVIMVHSSSIFLFFLDHPICPSIHVHKQSFPIFDFSLKQTICLWFPTFFLLIVSDTKVILTTLSISTDGFISAADFFYVSIWIVFRIDLHYITNMLTKANYTFHLSVQDVVSSLSVLSI